VGELEPRDPGAVGELDAAVLLEEMWRLALPVPGIDDAEVADLLGPYSRAFPGLSEPTGPQTGVDDLADAVALLPPPLRLGLVGVRLPGRVLAGHRRMPRARVAN
jgi:hypothetical protein